MIRLDFAAYCGMSGIDREAEDLTEARRMVARKIRRYRAMGRRIVTLTSGRRWEFLEPEDCLMIPDDAGILALEAKCADCRGAAPLPFHGRREEARYNGSEPVCDGCEDARQEESFDSHCSCANANARLIAAAPDLYAAAKVAAEFLAEVQVDDPCEAAVLGALRDAIRKAEGAP